jgi:hypothetical protein
MVGKIFAVAGNVWARAYITAVVVAIATVSASIFGIASYPSVSIRRHLRTKS